MIRPARHPYIGNQRDDDDDTTARARAGLASVLVVNNRLQFTMRARVRDWHGLPVEVSCGPMGSMPRSYPLRYQPTRIVTIDNVSPKKPAVKNDRVHPAKRDSSPRSLQITIYFVHFLDERVQNCIMNHWHETRSLQASLLLAEQDKLRGADKQKLPRAVLRFENCQFQCS